MPLHPDLAEVIARRTKGKADAAVDEAKPAKAKRTARPRKPKADDTAEG